MITPVTYLLLYCEAQLSEYTFKYVLCYWAGGAWSVSVEGESSRLRVCHSTSLHSPFPPLTLTKKGHRLPADGITRVAPNYTCLMHKFMLLLL